MWVAVPYLALPEKSLSADEAPIWTCSYVASTPRGPLQITAKFQIVGDELAEIETVPQGLNFSERYGIQENTPADIVAAISSQSSASTHLPASAPFVIIIAKQNGLFRQSGAILGLRSGDPTLGSLRKSLRQEIAIRNYLLRQREHEQPVAQPAPARQGRAADEVRPNYGGAEPMAAGLGHGREREPGLGFEIVGLVLGPGFVFGRIFAASTTIYVALSSFVVIAVP
jgi:hypothetical protein